MAVVVVDLMKLYDLCFYATANTWQGDCQKPVQMLLRMHCLLNLIERINKLLFDKAAVTAVAVAVGVAVDLMRLYVLCFYATANAEQCQMLKASANATANATIDATMNANLLPT